MEEVVKTIIIGVDKYASIRIQCVLSIETHRKVERIVAAWIHLEDSILFT